MRKTLNQQVDGSRTSAGVPYVAVSPLVTTATYFAKGIVY